MKIDKRNFFFVHGRIVDQVVGQFLFHGLKVVEILTPQCHNRSLSWSLTESKLSPFSTTDIFRVSDSVSKMLCFSLENRVNQIDKREREGLQVLSEFQLQWH